MPNEKKTMFEDSVIVASVMCGADLVTTLLGFSVGASEANPLVAYMPFVLFVIFGWMVQIVCTFIIAYAWNCYMRRPSIGLIMASLPRGVVVVSNIGVWLSMR